MEPEPGNPLEAEGVLNPAAVRGLTASFTSSRVSSRGAIIRGSASRAWNSMTTASAGVERLGIGLTRSGLRAAA